ncbi:MULTISPECIES: hypothetical protein [unclassified Pseudonocardia]|uniref:hypothetical protein n=1 Tax=unclassified Pseudonocardia TaxID=2619320 RepID=UPI000761CF0D|nr:MULTISPECIES: hypothetical protein [unclassified Pseudonocardia]
MPIVTGSTGVVLSVFGPRNPGEVERILTADGILLVASARPEHLHELRTLVGGIGVDPHKAARHRAAFTGFVPVVLPGHRPAQDGLPGLRDVAVIGNALDNISRTSPHQ